MSAPTIPTCSLSLTPDDLSAWRDHALSPANEQRIADHTDRCAACQRIIAAHDALADALRAEQPPAPDSRNWPRLQARISGVRQPLSARSTLRRAQRPAVWGGLSAAAAVLLLSALFFHLFSQQAGLRGGSSKAATVIATPSPLSTVAPTAPIAGQTLYWQLNQAPSSVTPIVSGDKTHNNSFTFAPTDARTGYLCAMTITTTTAVVDVWATHDSAHTWSQVNHATYDQPWEECAITIDAGQSMRVELELARLTGRGTSTSITMLSDDGGKMWRTVTTDHRLTNLVTLGNASIAVISPWPPASGPGGEPLPLKPATYPHIVVSQDGWHTWQPIDSGLNAQGLFATDVWQRPGDGALLAEADMIAAPANLADAVELWQSVDLGAHWTRVPTPTNLVPFSGYLVAQPQANTPWRVCGVAELGHGTTQTILVGCTQDGGQTWQSRPLPALPAPCGNICSIRSVLTDAAILPDGSLLGEFSGVLYLLAPHTTQWMDIGPSLGGGPFVCGAPTVTLYSVGNASTLLDEPSGSIIGSGGNPDPREIAVATLP